MTLFAKLIISVIACLSSSLVIAQSLPGKGRMVACDSVPGLVFVDSIDWPLLREGFSCSMGFWGYGFQLDSTMRFEKIAFGCTGSYTEDKAHGKLKKIINWYCQSARGTLAFYIFRFDRSRFLVSVHQEQSFIYDLRSAWEKGKVRKPFELDGEYYGPAFIAASLLTGKYYSYY